MLAAVDAADPKNKPIIDQFPGEIPGYPTFIYFKNGEKQFKYDGERAAKSFVDFMTNPTAPKPAAALEKWTETSAKAILHLNEANFMKTLKRKRFALVMFYTDWCGHCKSLKPHYEKSAEYWVEHDSKRVAFAAVNCDDEAKLCGDNGVAGYPTVKV